jgi:hypothetical protein
MTEPSVERLRDIDLEWLRAAVPKTLAGDAAYARVRFAHFLNRLPGDPTLINDMLYERKANGTFYEPLRSFVTDKEYVKIFVEALVGAEHAIPTIAVLHNESEARSYHIAEQCVLKPTHMSAQVEFAGPDTPFDWDAKKFWWTTNYYDWTGEANYRYLTPKVIVEPVLFDDHDITDYKFFCWKGEPRIITVDIGRFTNHHREVFDANWVPQPLEMMFPRPAEAPEPPAELEDALDIARMLASRFDFMRVDLYLNSGRIIVGELTNCPSNAGSLFTEPHGERLFSDLLFA